jgi:hypothetical protein
MRCLLLLLSLHPPAPRLLLDGRQPAPPIPPTRTTIPIPPQVPVEVAERASEARRQLRPARLLRRRRWCRLVGVGVRARKGLEHLLERRVDDCCRRRLVVVVVVVVVVLVLRLLVYVQSGKHNEGESVRQSVSPSSRHQAPLQLLLPPPPYVLLLLPCHARRRTAEDEEEQCARRSWTASINSARSRSVAVPTSSPLSVP